MILYADACNRQENYIPRKLLQHLLPKHTKAGVGRSKKFIIDINIFELQKNIMWLFEKWVGYKNELTLIIKWMVTSHTFWEGIIHWA